MRFNLSIGCEFVNENCLIFLHLWYNFFQYTSYFILDYYIIDDYYKGILYRIQVIFIHYILL